MSKGSSSQYPTVIFWSLVEDIDIRVWSKAKILGSDIDKAHGYYKYMHKIPFIFLNWHTLLPIMKLASSKKIQKQTDLVRDGDSLGLVQIFIKTNSISTK